CAPQPDGGALGWSVPKRHAILAYRALRAPPAPGPVPAPTLSPSRTMPMTMDSDFLIDVGEVRESLASAEVISVFFPLLQKVLLVDTRHDEVEGPMVKVATVAASMEHRLRALRRMRPRFDRPQ